MCVCVCVCVCVHADVTACARSCVCMCVMYSILNIYKIGKRQTHLTKNAKVTKARRIYVCLDIMIMQET